MLAGNFKLKHFLVAVGVGVLVCGGLAVLGPGAALWALISRPAPTPAPMEDVAAAPAPPPTPNSIAQKLAQAPAAPAAPAPVAPAPDGRPVDQAVFQWVGKDLGSSKLKDVTSGRSFKVNLYQDEGHTTMNRAKVDLDRDDKWDEKWTIDGTRISRKVAPNDDENYTESYLWTGSDWAAE